MGEISNQGIQPGGMGIDLSQFFEIFFEEAYENLASYESLLLETDPDAPDDEALNAIFRAAHSIKGGAATFGFVDVAELTHELETLLDLARRHELQLSTEMIDCLLASGDALKAQLKRHQDGGTGEPTPIAHLVSDLRRHAAGQRAAPPVQTVVASAADAPAPKPAANALNRTITIRIGPLTSAFDIQNLLNLFDEIPGMGAATFASTDDATSLEFRDLSVVTSSTNGDLIDLFTFYIDRDKVTIMETSTGLASAASAPADPGFGLFEDLEAPSSAHAAFTALARTSESSPAIAPAATAKIEKPVAAAESTTLRVSVEKIDQLINLVGELVITQAMLAQKAQALDPNQHNGVVVGLTDLERNTRDLQDSVMGIRMIPMSFVFNRFPRMLRDLTAKLGKKIELKTSGEATELDKGLIEKITDPLTHLVRNSVDHGIESPADRAAAGKPVQGTITLSARHQGGSIVIEVRDDGRGLNRQRILDKAVEKGIPVSDRMSDQEVWQLIFAPGFSTADVVTDVSGRGVGMDVVKRNITALGGTVELDSGLGHGTRVSVRLPLTLAIMDGMSVGVGGEVYILPLASVVETFQADQSKLKSLADQGKVVQVREEYLPVRRLATVFDVPAAQAESERAIMVIVEADGRRSALIVDELIGQHQVVVKNLEANYRKVDGISGATILGDGRVGLILDISYLVN
ncbi:MAG: chemotaxis protein CheW [Aeromicrobium sp.]|nr:chemotaxis protein CheW [Burkholderiales bacterium]